MTGCFWPLKLAEQISCVFVWFENGEKQHRESDLSVSSTNENVMLGKVRLLKVTWFM